MAEFEVDHMIDRPVVKLLDTASKNSLEESDNVNMWVVSDSNVVRPPFVIPTLLDEGILLWPKSQ